MSKARDLANSTSTLSVDGGSIKLDGNYPVGTGNVALGDGALDNGSLSGNYNTALGGNILGVNTTGNQNTAIGFEALRENVDGVNNTAVGLYASLSNTSGSYNVAVGLSALHTNITADNNTAVGYQAGYSNTAAGGTFVGYRSGYGNTSGIENTAIGKESQFATTTGRDNVSLGSTSLYNITSGSYNTAIGNYALLSNTTASDSVAVGYQAGYTNQTGRRNVFIGKGAGYTSNATTNQGYNTFVGQNAGRNVTTGYGNTFIGSQDDTSGYGAGHLVISGSKNTILGGYNGNQGGLDIRSSSNNIVLSDGDGNVRLHIDGSGNVGIGGLASSAYKSNTNRLTNGVVANFNSASSASSGNYVLETSLQQYSNNTNNSHVRSVTQNVAIWHLYGNGTMSWSSDERLKKNIETTRDGYLDDISKLRVVKYNWHNDEDGTPKELGLIAQEVEQVFPNLIATEEVELNGMTDTKVIKGSVIPYMLLKALQEANSTIKELEARITQLETN